MHSISTQTSFCTLSVAEEHLAQKKIENNSVFRLLWLSSWESDFNAFPTLTYRFDRLAFYTLFYFSKKKAIIKHMYSFPMYCRWCNNKKKEIWNDLHWLQNNLRLMQEKKSMVLCLKILEYWIYIIVQKIQLKPELLFITKYIIIIIYPFQIALCPLSYATAQIFHEFDSMITLHSNNNNK